MLSEQQYDIVHSFCWLFYDNHYISQTVCTVEIRKHFLYLFGHIYRMGVVKYAFMFSVFLVITSITSVTIIFWILLPIPLYFNV